MTKREKLLDPQDMRILATLFVGYLILALGAIYLSRRPGNIATLWFANGMGIVVLASQPGASWWRLLLTMALSNFSANLAFGDKPMLALAFVAPNTVEMLFGAWLIRKTKVFSSPGPSTRSLLSLLACGGLLAPLLGATLGSVTVAALGLGTVERVWLSWYEGAVVGGTAVLPVAYLLLTQGWMKQLRLLLSLESLGLFLLCLGVAGTAWLWLPYPFVYPSMVLVGMALRVPLFSLASTVFWVIVVFGFALAEGILVPPPITNQWEELLIYLPVMAATIPGLLLSVNLEVNRRTMQMLEQQRNRYRSLFENMPSMVQTSNRDGVITSVNRAWLEHTGYEPQEVLGTKNVEYLSTETVENEVPRLRSVLATEGSFRQQEIQVVRRDGSVMTVLCSAHAELDSSGEVEQTLITMEDISERKRLAESLAQDHALITTVFRSMGDAVVYTDEAGRIRAMNPVAEALTGRSEVESRGRPFAEIVTIIDRDTDLPIGDLVHHCLEKKAKLGLPENAVLIHVSGKEIPIQDSIAPILTDEGRLLGAVMVFQDVSHARAMAEKMAHLAQFDALTDLPNRVLLQDRLAQAMSLSERSGKKFALMYLDLDHFKHINDSLGHEFGDDLLRQVSKRLLGVLRHSDTASRIGGDEFVILLPEVSNPTDVGEVASKILSEVAKPYQIKSELLTVTVSIGISVFPDDGREIENLKREADIAMYQAKKESGNSYRFFSQAMDEMAVKRARLNADMRRDLGGPRFQVHYQPIVDAKRGTVVALEALVRWNRTDAELEPPSEFIPYAEESGLIVPLGHQVFRQACRNYRELSALYSNGVRISVNMSAKQIMSPDFVQTVRDCLAETSIDPTCLEFEITESALLNESKLVAEGLAFIESCGIGLALDDFGNGYSSFGYLKRWKVNTLKIDQSFVRNILEDQDDREIVTSMVLIGKTLGLSVIAEGVETIEQKELLEQIGCDELQGYYFSRPRPMSELLLVPTN